MAVVLEELLVTMRADLDQYNLRIESMRRDTDRRLDLVERRFTSFEGHLRSTASRAAIGVRNAMAGIGAALTVNEIAGFMDQWVQVRRSLESTSQFFGVATRSAEELSAMAVRTRSDLDALSKLYTKMSIAAQRLGYDEQAGAEATETFAMALKLGQAAASEQASAIKQFAQGLQSGVLRGDEFNSIMENAGVVAEALARKLRTSTGGLRQMAEEGQITARHMIEALRDVRPAVVAAFSQAPTTLSESVTNLNTALIEYIGRASEVSGVTQSLAGGLNSIAANLDTIGKTLIIAGAGMLVLFAPQVLAAVSALGAGILAAGAALGSVQTAATAVAALFTSGVVGARLFGDQISVIADHGVTMTDVFALLKEHVFSLQGAGRALGDMWTAVLNAISSELRGAGEGFAVLVSIVRNAVNVTVGVLRNAVPAIKSLLFTIPNALAEAMVAAANFVIRQLKSMLEALAYYANRVPGVKMSVDFDEIENPFAGYSSKLKQETRNIAADLGRDFVGEWTDSISGMGEAVSKELVRIAADRRAREEAEQWAQGTGVVRPSNAVTTPPHARTRRNPYERDVARIQERTAALIAEARAVGTSARETERAVAMEELLSAAKQAGLKITPQLISDMDRLARAYAAASTELALMHAIQRRREETDATRREIDLTGLWGYELHRARVEMELLTEAQRQGVTLTEQRRQEISDTAAAAAATETLRDALSEVRDTSKDALKSFIGDIREGKSATEALGGALNRIADKLLDMAANQLVEAALGGLLQGAGGARGGSGLITSIFGFANGGVMTAAGPRALQKFASGGISNRAAIFGEGPLPEAAVPLPDGRRIPVDLRIPAINAAAAGASSAGQTGVSVNVSATYNLQPGVTAAELAAVKTEMAATMPRIVQQGINQAFDRNARFARTKV